MQNKDKIHEILSLPGDGIKCTAAVILDNDKKILLGLRHYKNKWEGELIANSLWTTPGGRTDEGETVGDCLVRETLEETGLTIKPTSYLGELPAARNVDTLHVFYCEHDGEPKNMEPHKFEHWKWFNIGEIPENFINPYLKEMLLKDLWL